jgi:GT2 family glycosyltransferase
MSMSKPYPSVAVVLLNYNGERFLPSCLPCIISAAEAYGGKARIIMVDNASTDGSVEMVAGKFPSIEILNHRNDFLFSFNDVMDNLADDIAILINNDVLVDRRFISPLATHFGDPEVFAVGPRQLSWENREFQQGALSASLDNLLFTPKKFPDLPEATYSLYVSGCAFAVNVEKFRRLGGFNPVFKPYYFEETDLCLRAWGEGWKVVYEPHSIVLHEHHGSMGKARSRSERDLVYWCNLVTLSCGFPLTISQRLLLLTKGWLIALGHIVPLLGCREISFFLRWMVGTLHNQRRYRSLPEEIMLVGCKVNCSYHGNPIDPVN